MSQVGSQGARRLDPRPHTWAPIGLLAMVLLFPPEVYPEAAVAALFGAAALLAGLGRRVVSSAGSLGAFLGVASLSLLWTPKLDAGVTAVCGWVLAAALFALLAGQPESRARLALVAVAGVHGLHAGWQKWVSLPALATELGGSDDPLLLLAAGRAAEGRAFSTLSLPGHLGALLAALLPILAYEVWTARGWRRGLAIASILATLLGLRASAALGGVVALAVVVAGEAGWRGGSRRYVVLALALGLLITVGVTRLDDLSDVASHRNPVATRLELWKRAVDVARSSPVVGVGIGGYQVAWLPYRRATDVPARNAHMSYLEVGAELGALGLCLLGVFLVQAVRQTRSGVFRTAALVLLVHAAFDFDLQTSSLQVAALGLLALGQPQADTRRAGFGLAVAALVACGLMLWRGDSPNPLADAVGMPAGRVWLLDSRAGVQRVHDLMSREQNDQALAEVTRLRHLEPVTPHLAALEGEVRLRRGEVLAAYIAFEESARLHPAEGGYGARAAAVAATLGRQFPKTEVP